MLRYFVEIVGHEPPFKYALKRERSDGKIEQLGEAGQVHTVQEAIDLARAAAERYEYDRRYRETVDRVTVLEADDAPRGRSEVSQVALAELERSLNQP